MTRHCPSAPAAAGAAVIGVVEGDGSVSILPDAIPVDGALLAVMRDGRTPEARFRFASRCQTAKCGNWGETGCGLVQRAGLDLAGRPPPQAPVSCAIRKTCVWHAQAGLEACRICVLVVTDPEPAAARNS